MRAISRQGCQADFSDSAATPPRAACCASGRGAFAMRIIPTRIHGMLDYLVGLVLILAPFLLGFAHGGAAQYVPQAVGLATIGLALVTDYELGVARIVPMSIHLMVDLAAGVLLLISPWLFGFAGFITWPHVLFGLLAIGVALLSSTTPGSMAAVTGGQGPGPV
jgi:hypothetical protein